MLRFKASNLVILAAVCLLGAGSSGPARAACSPCAVEWSGGQVIDLGQGLPNAINDAGQVVGPTSRAAEWRGGGVISLGGLPDSTGSGANAINDGGQAAGFSYHGNNYHAVEWSGGQVIDLGPGESNAINDAGQVVGTSD